MAAQSPSDAATPPSADETDSRTVRFIRSALAILAETGRTDFTVLEVVERSRTSLRAFYQHFATKDELLLALVDQTMADAVAQWRSEVAPLPADQSLRRLFERISAPPDPPSQTGIDRVLMSYNDHLLEVRPRDFATVLSPLHTLLIDIVRQGVIEGVFRADIDVEIDAAILMQTVLGAMRLRELGAELNGAPIEASHLYTFCVRGLLRSEPRRIR
jgi:AcrR family transcriptional regulator